MVRDVLGTSYLSRPVQRAIEAVYPAAYRAGRADGALAPSDDDVEQAHSASSEVIWKKAFEVGKRAGREDAAQDIERLWRALSDAANAHCGCLGSTISEYGQ